ncbi:carboxyltransferase domain-containing protein [Leucobacter sp. CSA2]|uniref:Carboxyltransferase domain-containing protein n=1 Tax=Leucobacter edaphi TaxID=2796472 RepID=A0A934UWV1_9MICO|nr:carboxyltransferase domain-containing protein [Leucobacter edaphi]
MTVRIRDVGDRALLVELPGLDDVLGLAAALRAAPPDGVIDIVPATTTVLVTFSGRAAARAAAETIPRIRIAPDAARRGAAAVVIDTVYDGPDLRATAELLGLSTEALVAAHSGSDWIAAFGGFAPGFAYLTGGDPRLAVPRLSTPRTAVPAGSVAIAGGFSAVYPGESPGGWRLLGRTEARLWDTAREAPALIEPGASVRFRPIRDTATAGVSAETAGRAGSAGPGDGDAAGRPDAAAPALTIIDPGFLALVEDGGRPGRAAIGVTGSGALDRGALARANAAAGNPAHAAGIESLNGGITIEANAPIVVAVAGAPGPIERRGATDGSPAWEPAEAETSIPLAAGERLRLGAPETGLRRYLAVRGGILGRRELGSAAHDSLSGMGTPPLARGARLAIGAAGEGTAPETAPETSPGREPAPAPDGTEPHVLRYVPGPRDDWFAEASRSGFGAREWVATAQSNRIGVRLATANAEPPLERARDGELPTEGTVAGSIQIPPSGLPVLFLADRPVTGGYPVIGTVIDADLDRAAQVRPGERIRFQPVDPDRIAPLERGAGGARERPHAVPLTLEADGRRIGVTIPGALAAALDRLISEASADTAESTIAAFLEPIVRESLLASD